MIYYGELGRALIQTGIFQQIIIYWLKTLESKPTTGKYIKYAYQVMLDNIKKTTCVNWLESKEIFWQIWVFIGYG